MGSILGKQELSQEALKFLTEHSRYEEHAIKEWYRDFKRESPNGRITPVLDRILFHTEYSAEENGGIFRQKIVPPYFSFLPPLSEYSTLLIFHEIILPLSGIF